MIRLIHKLLDNRFPLFKNHWLFPFDLGQLDRTRSRLAIPGSPASSFPGIQRVVRATKQIEVVVTVHSGDNVTRMVCVAESGKRNPATPSSDSNASHGSHTINGLQLYTGGGAA
jgi:hypothetical protein